MRGHARYSARKNFPALSDKFLEEIRIFVVDCLCRDIDSTARHDAVCASEVRPAFGGFRFHRLFNLPVQGATVEKRIVFLFFQATGRVGAFLVSRRDIPGNRLTFRSRFCALQSNDIPWHDGYSFESVMLSSSSPSPPS